MTDKETIEVTTNITFRNVQSSDALKQYVDEKIGKAIHKFAHKNVDVHVVLQVEKHRQIAEITCNVDSTPIAAKEEDVDLYKAIDKLVATLSAQLRKNKEKITQHHA